MVTRCSVEWDELVCRLSAHHVGLHRVYVNGKRFDFRTLQEHERIREAAAQASEFANDRGFRYGAQ